MPTAPALVRDLERHGERLALLAQDGSSLSYAELARTVEGQAEALGRGRRLVLVAGSATVGSITAYLAALAAGHVVLLAPGDRPAAVSALVEAYDPDLILDPPATRAGPVIAEHRREGTRHHLHPDLALLLSTSGSTGSPKLVRLSYENLDSNAAAIVEGLGIGPSDRAATTLPMHYTYGLSVIHSHLMAGAGLIVTDHSVVDPCFWDRFRAEGGTTLAGVPYTFDLLDRIDFGAMHLPSLRSVTQAGGRLDPERVRTYAELGRRQGWTFTVMYGQTEATARMAILPPELASAQPASIGRAIPGGHLRIEPVDGVPEGVGEIVYQGPNVMLGYARTPADLVLGRTVDELATGDLGRALPDGLFEVTGRRDRVIKVTGLRIDLEHVERRLRADGWTTWLVGRDGHLVATVEAGVDQDRFRRRVAELAGVAVGQVATVEIDAVPRLASGKVDRAAILAMAPGQPETPVRRPDEATSPTAAVSPVRAITNLYEASLRRPVGPTDSFVALGGDSLSYVQVSLGLEDILDRLPPGWPTLTVAELAVLARPPAPTRRSAAVQALGLRWVDMTVLLRAVAILCIVAQHTGLAGILGGAHVLVAVAGYNFARFQLTPASRLDRLRSQGRAIGRIVIPAVIWIALMLLVTDDYGLPNLFLANAIVGPERFDTTWHFWFIEMLVYVLVVMAALVSIPVVDRFERRRPFALAAALVAVGLLFRFGILDHDLTNPRPIFWLFAIGWAAGKATTRRQRLALAIVTLVAVPGFYGDVQRDLVIAGGVIALIAVRAVPIPGIVRPALGVLASASLYIYLVHWQIWTSLDVGAPGLVFALCLAAGVAAWWLAGQLAARIGDGRGRSSRFRNGPRRTEPTALATG